MNKNELMGFIRLLAAASLALLAHAALAVEPLAWFSEGRPSVQAQQALALLGDAATHGLDPADYDAERLVQAAGNLARQSPVDLRRPCHVRKPSHGGHDALPRRPSRRPRGPRASCRTGMR